MKKFFSLVATTVLFTIAGCSSSQYLVDKPFVLYPQTILTEEVGDAQARSMKALFVSFSDRGWEIHNIDKTNNTITAEACRRGAHCMEVLATVNKNGSVELIRTPGQDLTRNEGELLRRWLGLLNRSYIKHIQTSLKK